MSTSTAIGAARAAWLVVGLRLRRLLNQITSGVQRFRRRVPTGHRAATAGKNRVSWLVGSLVAVSMLFSFTNLARQALAHMQNRFGSYTLVRAEVGPEPFARTGWLGVQVRDLTTAEAQALGWDQPRGAKIVACVATSPAAEAGIRPDDIAVALDEREVSGAANFTQMVGAMVPGGSVELRVLRDGAEQRVRVIVGQRPTPPPTGKQAIRGKLPVLPGYRLAWGVLQGCVLEACILLLASLLISLASRDFAAPDWDLEWLVTLPVSLATLLGVRIVERTLINPAGLLTLGPFLTVVAWEGGHRIAAPLLGLVATILLLAIATVIWTVLETGLRLRVSPSKRRNVQALVSVTSAACLYLAMSAGMSADSYVMRWAPELPLWSLWLPPGLAISALTSAKPAGVSVAMLGLVVETLTCAVLGLGLLKHQLRLGVVGAAGRESGGRGVANQPIAAAIGRARRRKLLSPIQARELRLLGRDRNFLVQTLVLPIVIIGAQVLLNTPGRAFATGFGSPEQVAAAAFGIGAYALMFSAFQTLNAEGQALWILYCVPQSLEAVLREKATLWGTVCVGYAIAVLAFGLAFNPAFSLHQLELMIVVLLGVPIFATVGTALGVFACDPLAQLVQRRVRPSYLYLYMLLASLYVYAIYASNVWQRTGLVVLTALLGMALWQKARDHLPYLLDADALPPARVSLADGLIAALLFFVLQALVAIVLAAGGQKLTGREVVVAYSVAGAVTYCAMRITYWCLKAEGVPRAIGRGFGRALGWGASGGAVAAVVAIAYLRAAAHTSLFENVRDSLFTGRDGWVWFAVLAVVAAPVCEEFIFRGLIFGGLRRSLGISASVLASAAIFALVHPAPSVIPVFGLGVAAALVYERTRLLQGPMAVHAVYNAAIVVYRAVS